MVNVEYVVKGSVASKLNMSYLFSLYLKKPIIYFSFSRSFDSVCINNEISMGTCIGNNQACYSQGRSGICRSGTCCVNNYNPGGCLNGEQNSGISCYGNGQCTANNQLGICRNGICCTRQVNSNI